MVAEDQDTGVENWDTDSEYTRVRIEKHKDSGDCPMFEGMFREDPQAHVMTYHLWCSSNSWVDDSVRLRLF